MTQEADPLQAGVDTSLAQFTTARAGLEAVLAPAFTRAAEAAEGLLSLADEFGPSHAVEALLAEPSRFGPVKEGAGDHLRASEADLTTRLEQLLDSHDALDRATAQQEAARGRAEGPVRQLHIQGRLFALDIDARGLVRAEPVADRTDALPLAARLMEKLGTSRAEAHGPPDRNRTPERGR
jgi:hypothetical protein